MSSPSSVLTRGYGSWGSANLVVTLGYGDFDAVGGATIIGSWSNVLRYTSPNKRLEYTSNERLEYTSPNKRLET
jgi:hypothetical protein